MNHYQKNQKNSEKRRGIYFQLGLIIAGGFALLAFEWTFPTKIAELQGTIVDDMEWDLNYVEPFEIEKEEEKQEEKEETTQKTDQFEEVDNDHKEKEEEEKKEEDKKKDNEFNDNDWKSKENLEEEAPLPIAEIMPEFQGGMAKLFEYLGKNLKYPQSDKIGGIQGKVYVSFVVNKKGEIRDVKVERGVSPTIDAEAIRVVKAMPNWKAGKNNGRTVSVRYMLPISFKLR